MKIVGKNLLRKEGIEKVTGKARYIDDYSFPGMIYGRTIRSTIPCGEVAKIEINFNTDGFTIVDYQDIPGKNVISFIEDDQPCLAEQKIRHAEEPILLLAHPNRDKLLQAEPRISYKAETPIYDIEKSPKIFKTILIEKGDLQTGFSQADFILEGEYKTGYQEHLYIETNGVIAVPEKGGIILYGSMQCPYYVHKALKVLLNLPDEKVRVIQTETGGAFGGKEEYPSMISCHAALLAVKSGKPVKIIYDRMEDMAATTKRHPAIIRHKTGVKKNGKLTAMEIDFLLDGGAYTTLSPVVLSRGAIHAAGAYFCENIRISAKAFMTNTPPNGAFRGFGAPQSQFALEVQLDRIAEQLHIDPVKIREENALIPGLSTATGQIMGKDCSTLKVLKEGIKKSEYYKKAREYKGTNKGIGISLFFHGAGFTGSGEVYLASKAALELTKKGVRILVSSTEMGQGARTILAQIVAETMGLTYDQVDVEAADTARVPDSGPTVASRTCMIIGKLLQKCAEEMKEKLGKHPPKEYLKKFGPLVITKQYEKPPEIEWDDNHYQGSAYGTYGYACDIAEVEVDPITYEVKVNRITTAAEGGKLIHPVLAKGQIEGGTIQGLGYALFEQVVMKEGRMANCQLTNYIIPTTCDTPILDTTLLENPYQHGPFGAKGLAELPLDGVAPAVVNAVRNIGYDLREIPAAPEKLLNSLPCH